MQHTRRNFLKKATLGSIALTGLSASCLKQNVKQPNFVVIFCDDLGYGDLGVFGHPTIKTPNLDKMAFEGQKWTNFYAAASVCTPSRAGIMTGRLPIRNGMMSAKRRVLFPDSAGGLPQSEITIATALKAKGYKTACIGKWHLGHLPQYLPTSHGFDSYFGIPYSNDMDKVAAQGKDVFADPDYNDFNVPLMQDDKIIERPADQNTITKRYFEKAIEQIKQNKNEPFFIYLAHNLPHVPLFASKDFLDSSLRGLYGDVIEEIDHGVGQILKALKDNGVAENTLVVFTSDNGPWHIFKTHGGSAGMLRGYKGDTFEGGMREPTIFYWPGTIQPEVVAGIGCTTDLMATFCSLAGAQAPTDRELDSIDLSPTILSGEKSPRDEMYYFREEELYAVRKGAFKAHFITKKEYTQPKDKTYHNPPLLFNLEHDPSEKYDVAKENPEIIAQISKLAEDYKKTLTPVENQLEKKI